MQAILPAHWPSTSGAFLARQTAMGIPLRELTSGAFEAQREADLLVSLGADKMSVRQGDSLTYTISVSNFSRGEAQNIVVNDVLSSGTTFVCR